MGFLKRFFGSAIEQAQELDAAMASCQFESSNKDCSLVQQLKDKQAKKREIDAKITSFEKHEPVVLEKFMEFLLKLERNRFEMGMDYRSYHMPGVYNSKIKDTFGRCYGVERFEAVIDQTTMADIDAIHEELRAMKDRVNVLSGLHQQSKLLGNEIKGLKDQLGIE